MRAIGGPVTKGNIGIIGSGDVGQALARGLARHGYSVAIGSRSPAKLADLAKAANVTTGTFADAARHGDVVILATLGAGTVQAIETAGADHFGGKLVIDATNPLDFSKGMPPGLLVGTMDSLGETVQRKLPSAKVVKCFNTVPYAQMVDPKFTAGAPHLLVCGNDADAKKRVEALVRDLGWPGVLDVGGIDGARWLEALVPLWVRAGVATGTWSHAFKVVT